MTTQKVKSTGRFGVRYGVTIRKRMLKVESQQKQFSDCPSCGFKKVKRISTGVFTCRKCNYTFAGGAYLPRTLAGTIIQKMVTQKSFVPATVTELALATEKTMLKGMDEKVELPEGAEKQGPTKKIRTKQE